MIRDWEVPIVGQRRSTFGRQYGTLIRQTLEHYRPQMRERYEAQVQELARWDVRRKIEELRRSVEP